MNPIEHPDAMQGALREAALDQLVQTVRRQHQGDENYLRGQLPRYARSGRRIQSLVAAPCRVLDIGSHYLHQATMLRALGYDVTGIDVPLFTEAPFVRERAEQAGIRNVGVERLEDGDFLPGEEGRYRLVVFTEILEHITFNPVRFWRRVHALLEPGGMVYLSTPNSLRPAAWARAMRDLLAFRGRGIGLEEILGTVTYGHHWKEYSAGEIVRYFGLLSPDFVVETRFYSTDLDARSGWKGRVKAALAVVPAWRSDIEAVVRKAGQAGFAAAVPQLKMQSAKTAPAAPDGAARAGAGREEEGSS